VILDAILMTKVFNEDFCPINILGTEFVTWVIFLGVCNVNCSPLITLTILKHNLD